MRTSPTQPLRARYRLETLLGLAAADAVRRPGLQGDPRVGVRPLAGDAGHFRCRRVNGAYERG